MPQTDNKIRWENETGSIIISGDGKEERIFTISKNFMKEFKEELVKTSGKSPFKMTIRKMLEKLGETPGEGEVTWESIESYNDRQILPVSQEPSIPQEYQKWDGKTRNLVLLPDLEVAMWTVKSLQTFKEAMADIMTEKGANAILNGAGKKAGTSIGEQYVKYFGWTDLQNALDTIDGIAQKMNALAGWSKGKALTIEGKDKNPMILLKSWNSFEVHGKKSERPLCIITNSLINGIWDSFANTLAGKSAEAREVKCSAAGSDYCAFAIKLKEKGSPPLDWKELQEEWQSLDAK